MLIKWFKNLKFQLKILIAFLIVSIIPIVILGIFSYTQTKDLLLHQAENNINSALKQKAISLKAQLESCSKTLNYISFDKDVIDVTTYHYNNYYEMYYKFTNQLDDILLTTYSQHNIIKRLSIYSSTNVARHYPHIMPVKEITNTDWYDTLSNSINSDWHVADNGNLFIAQRIITPPINSLMNVLYMEIDYDSIFESFNNLFNEPYGVIITNANNDVLYKQSSSNTELSLQTINKLIHQNNSKTDYLIFQEQIPSYNWKIYLYQPESVSINTANVILYTTQYIIIISIVAVLILVAFLSKLISKPIVKLTKNITQIEKNNLNSFLEVDTTDEIGILIDSFNNMITRINKLISEVYVMRIAKKDNKIKILKSQINSHFLYNCLSIINMKALLIDAYDISEMTKLLASFYRLHLNVDKSRTTVSKEIETVKTYLAIEAIRHNNNFIVEYDIDENVLYKECLNMILEPIVENAMVHGLDNKITDETPKIIIKVFSQNDDLIFIVKDNGCGIDDKVLSQIFSQETKGYGIKNVNSRIALYYGDEYGIKIDSKVNYGTTVTVTLKL